jgi:hypothetical protein
MKRGKIYLWSHHLFYPHGWIYPRQLALPDFPAIFGLCGLNKSANAVVRPVFKSGLA